MVDVTKPVLATVKSVKKTPGAELSDGMGELANGKEGPGVASEDRLALLWRRIKEHRIAQWTVGYVAIAYGVQHALRLTSEAFKWPDAVLRIQCCFLRLACPSR